MKTTKPLIRCLGDGTSEITIQSLNKKRTRAFSALNQEKNKNYKNNILINVEYQRLQKFK